LLITLFTDASFHPRTRASAFALYAISNRGNLNYASRFRGEMENSAHAELAAIGNALHIVLPQPMSAGATRVLIQSDCMDALRWINREGKAKYPEVVDRLWWTAEKYRVTLETRHVKGHVGIGEPRLYCQDWCDREAGRISRIMHLERGGAQRPSKRAHYRHRRRK